MSVSQRNDDMAQLLCSWGADTIDITEGKKVGVNTSCYWKDKGVSERDFQLCQVSGLILIITVFVLMYKYSVPV